MFIYFVVLMQVTKLTCGDFDEASERMSLVLKAPAVARRRLAGRERVRVYVVSGRVKASRE